jgi:glycosyltransferase involved in cell wall biosynthesis
MEPTQVSVVIPVYNRGKILRNTILSLNRQSYPKSRYQVIIVDDGSTDETVELLKQYASDHLNVISHPINKGAPTARNTGIQHAEGELIIFCDSDFILPSTFIESHVKEHENKENFAVSGMGHWHFILSYDYKDRWSELQKEVLEEKFNDPFIQQRMLNSPDHHLILEEEIYNENYTPFAFRPNLQFVKMFEEIISTHGPMLDHFYLPWITFCTGNVSIPKHCVNSLGGFDEQFSPLGYDDWELAYRFFLEGGRFCFSTNAEAFQQMTPANPDRGQIAVQNYQKFHQKHPDFEIFLLSLDLRKAEPYTLLSKILEQHKFIQKMGPKYKVLSEQFEDMLKLLALGHTPPFKNNPKFKKNASRKSNYLREYENLQKNLDVESWLKYYNKLFY